MALGIVYYMRLDSQYRKEYEEYLDKQVRVPNVSFSQVKAVCEETTTSVVMNLEDTM